ncbi:hypothetical protein B0H19DRAFT_1225768 [Mycena capillaripes]|nr:hypothetical protein B0H19DRAFT_1225768 [Mycena capillaripes]
MTGRISSSSRSGKFTSITNIHQAAPSAFPDFWAIPLVDLNLLHTIGPHGGVVRQRKEKGFLEADVLGANPWVEYKHNCNVCTREAVLKSNGGRRFQDIQSFREEIRRNLLYRLLRPRHRHPNPL